MLFLEIISWKGASCFNGGGGFVFQIGGLHFKRGVHPMGGASVLMGGEFEKNLRMEVVPPHAPHYG